MHEPSCGRGNFIYAALQTFPCLRQINGIEIYRPYIDELQAHLPPASVQVELAHADIFSFDFNALQAQWKDAAEILILGNPPWVTNSAQGRMEQSNLPPKVNFKGLRGIDALTGKGNFDIAEAITLNMLDLMAGRQGTLALLLKNSVIEKIVQSLTTRPSGLTSIAQYEIDALAEFGAATAASLLVMRFAPGQLPLMPSAEVQCTRYDFYTRKALASYGYCQGHFVSDVNAYVKFAFLDGSCPYEWRSGVKHDCAKVLELKQVSTGLWRNGLNDTVALEDDLIFPLVKSADLKPSKELVASRYLLLPQRRITDDTAASAHSHPLTYAYLMAHASYLDGRRSSIYRRRPRFAVFGLGDYSFMPYKVAIAGLSKEPHFVLLSPQQGKPILVDDTCYQLAFKERSAA